MQSHSIVNVIPIVALQATYVRLVPIRPSIYCRCGICISAYITGYGMSSCCYTHHILIIEYIVKELPTNLDRFFFGNLRKTNFT